MKKGLVAYLKNHGVCGGRVFPKFAPQGAALPHLIYFVVSDVPGLHLRGSDGVSNARIQLDVYGDSEAQVDAEREKLHDLLHGFAGKMGNVVVKQAFLEDQSGAHEPPTDAADLGYHRETTDLLARYERRVPNLIQG